MKKKDLFKVLTLLAFTAFLIVLAVFSFQAILLLKENYETLRNGDMAKGFSGSIFYDDRLYASIGYGLEIVANEPGAAERLNSFFSSSFLSIDRRILSCGLVYTMFGTSLLLYDLFSDAGEDGKRQILKAVAAVFGTYIFYVGMIRVMHMVCRIPFYLPGPGNLFSIFAGLISITGGCCAMGILLRKLPFKKIPAILMVPLVILLFLLSTGFESRFLMPEKIESFAYVVENDSRVQDENYEGEVYYDKEKNVLVIDGEEYPPEEIDNPEYLRGLPRIGAFLYEILDPYSGSSLFLAEEISESKGHPLIAAGYLLKAACWIALFKFLK